MEIVWLSSYPKSGNTWLRFLLHNYLYGIATDSSQVGQRIPDLHRLGNKGLADYDGQVLCKSHFLPSPQHPHLADTRGFIYLVRNPRDVLWSALNYKRTLGTLAGDDETFALQFIEQMGAPDWRQHGYGSWVEHVTAWTNLAPRVPHLLLRYEQLKADPEGGLTQALTFLGQAPDPHKVAEAVRSASFDEMKSLEKKERKGGQATGVFMAHYASNDQNALFMRGGKSGQSLTGISQKVENAFQQRFASVNTILGY